VRERSVHLPLTGFRLLDSRTGETVELGERPDVTVLTLIRHRY